MFIFIVSMIGVAVTLCAAPLLLLLGVMSLVGMIDVVITMKVKADSLFAFGGVLWCWAGFTGLSGYWRWIDIQGRELNFQDIEKLTAIKHRGIWGILALLPIFPAFQWFIIPVVCFLAYILWDIQHKINNLT